MTLDREEVKNIVVHGYVGPQMDVIGRVHPQYVKNEDGTYKLLNPDEFAEGEYQGMKRFEELGIYCSKCNRGWGPQHVGCQADEKCEHHERIFERKWINHNKRRENMTQPENVKDLVGLITYVREYADRILVKVNYHGVPTTAILADLDPHTRSEVEFSYLRDKTVPFRMLTKQEASEISHAQLILAEPPKEETPAEPTPIQPAKQP